MSKYGYDFKESYHFDSYKSSCGGLRIHRSFKITKHDCNIQNVRRGYQGCTRIKIVNMCSSLPDDLVRFHFWRCPPTQTPTQMLKRGFSMFSSPGIGSRLVPFHMIFEALRSELFIFKFHSLSSTILTKSRNFRAYFSISKLSRLQNKLWRWSCQDGTSDVFISVTATIIILYG